MSYSKSQLSSIIAKLENDVEDEVVRHLNALPQNEATITILKAAASMPRMCCLQEDWTADDFDDGSVFQSTEEQRDWLAKAFAKYSQDPLWPTVSVKHVYSLLSKLPPDAAAYFAYAIARWFCDPERST